MEVLEELVGAVKEKEKQLCSQQIQLEELTQCMMQMQDVVTELMDKRIQSSLSEWTSEEYFMMYE